MLTEGTMNVDDHTSKPLEDSPFDIAQLHALQQNSQTHLENIINAIGDPLFVKDRKHVWIYINDSFCSFIGHPRCELIGKSDYDYFPREQADVFWGKDEQVLATGRENVNEEAFTDGSGMLHTITTKKTLYTDNHDNKFIVGTIRDITEKKSMETALIESEEKFRRLTEDAPVGIYLFRADSTYEYLNPRFVEMFGYTLGDIPHRQAWFEKAYPDPAYRKKVVDAWENDRILSFDGQARERIFSIRCKDGTDKIIKIRTVKILQEKFLATCEDITELKLTEESLREALANIKTIKGYIPICASCKRIRTDKGAWQRLEQYFHEHIDADFSHGICDQCRMKLYSPDNKP